MTVHATPEAAPPRADFGAASYVERARAWLEAQAPVFGRAARVGLTLEEDLALGRRYQALKSEAGYASITLPRDLGGGGGTELEKILFGQEELRYEFPTAYFGVSLSMPIPMLIRYADAATVRRLAPPAIRGETIWCQLFSEPAAGSDLAALRLRARRGATATAGGWMARSSGPAGPSSPITASSSRGPTPRSPSMRA